MKIETAKTAGFCFGVNRAVKILGEKLDEGKKVCTLGPIIHNPQVIEELSERGALIIDNPSDAPEGYATKETWVYRMDMPEGYKHFSKTRPMRGEHTEEMKAWWNEHQEIALSDKDFKSKCFTPQELVNGGLNIDLCKFPKEEEEVLRPEDLLAQYWQRRDELDMRIDNTLAEIEEMLGLIKVD